MTRSRWSAASSGSALCLARTAAPGADVPWGALEWLAADGKRRSAMFGAAHAGGPRAQQAGKVEARLLHSRVHAATRGSVQAMARSPGGGNPDWQSLAYFHTW